MNGFVFVVLVCLVWGCLRACFFLDRRRPLRSILPSLAQGLLGAVICVGLIALHDIECGSGGAQGRSCDEIGLSKCVILCNEKR